MSHNEQKSSALKLLFASLLVSTSLMASSPAYSAIVPDVDLSKSGQSLVKTSLADWTEDKHRVLDWRSPKTTIIFDAPIGEWTDEISLNLSALPQNIMAAGKLTISFNGGRAVEIETGGQRFDAQIALSSLRVRPRNNRLTIAYEKPRGADCLQDFHGSWTIDLARSLIVIKARNKNRSLSMSEFEPRLRNQLTAPKSVSLIAAGEHKLALESLAAQAIGVRMDNLPTFKAANRAADLKIYMGTRARLGAWLTADDLYQRTGPALSLIKGRPLAMIITGDTEAEVLEAARNFARYELPNTSRDAISAGELVFQSQFGDQTKSVQRSVRLHEIGSTYFDMSYRPDDVKLSFDVAETQGVGGNVVLRLSKNDSVADNSRVTVRLNDNALGYTVLDRNHKSVNFDIPAGVLKASGNEITISPELEPAQPGCLAYGYEPGLGLGERSVLKLTQPQPQLSLSRFAASGAPFSHNYGADTTVIINETSAERLAAQSFMAKMAQTSGVSWSDAHYTARSDLAENTQNHIFMLGSANMAHPVLSGAPRALTAALRGEGYSPAAKKPVQFASNDANEVFAQFAALSDQGSARVTAGGVAALYTPAGDKGRAIGVISTSAGYNFSRSVSQLVKDDHWNGLSGSVSRWDRNDMVMAQASLAPLPKISGTNINMPITFGQDFQLSLSDLADTASDFAHNAFENGRDGLEELFSQIRKGTEQVKAAKPMPALPSVPEAKEASEALEPPKALSVTLRRQSVNPLVVVEPAAASGLSLRGPKAVSYAAASGANEGLMSWKAKLSKAFSLEGFDTDYFIANVKAKWTALGNKVKRATHKHIATPDIGQTGKSMLGNGYVALLLLAALFLVLMMAFVSPSAKNTHIS